MNLVAYDVINDINHKKTWIDIKNKYICSNELTIYKYYFIAKRYDKLFGTKYYIALSNTYSEDPQARKVYNPKNNKTKYYIGYVIDDILNNKRYDKDEIQIRLDEIEVQDDGVIYEIVI